MSPRQRLAALRRAERTLWELSHPGPEGRCTEGPIHDAAHLVFRARQQVERPGWDIWDREANESDSRRALAACAQGAAAAE